MRQFDAIVIGGGPAGSSSARRLAQHGLSTLLLEKKPMPRRKICGGALSEQAMSYLDFPLPESLIDWECFGARIHYGDRVIEGRLAERIAVLVTRASFDSYLVKMASEAGASVLFEQAREVSAGSREVEVTTDDGNYTARVVVIAAGANNRLAALVRGRDAKHEFGVTQEVEIPVGPRDRFQDLAGLIDVHFGVARHGYGWLFHHGDHYSVGVGGLRSRLPRPDRAMRQFMDSIGFTGKYPGLKGHPIPRGGVTRELVADRLMLAGDCAGFVDPFYGEGIAYAIRSGQLAADVIGECFERSGAYSAAELREYARRCETEFHANLRYSLVLSKLMYRFPGIFLRLLASNRRVLEKYLEVPLDRLTYRGFLLWLLPRLPWCLVKSALV